MKRTLAMILAIVMVIGVFPATVFAAEEFKITLTSDVEDVSALDVGSKITVTANLENNPGFAGIVTNLVWDNTVVKFEGFNVRYSEDLEQDVMVSDLVKTATYNQETGTVVYGSEKNVTKAGGKLWEAVFTVLKGGETGIALNTDGQEFQMTNANLEKLTPVIDQTALAGLTVEHTCVHVETVVAPTCTEGGYTLHKCACGDEYRTANTPAAGHKYENNICTVCGAPGTVIPEGAKFTDILTDKGEIVTVTEKDGYYLVEVPYGTTSLMVTYPEELPKVDEFGYATTHMVGFDGVSQDGYGITRKDGKIIVGLVLEKAPSNGAPTVVRLINLDDQYGKKVAIRMADGSEETFALTYKLGNGQYFAVLPLPENCVGYSITGEAIASDGYSFNVSILEGYEATENFAVKVNGQTVSTEPGRISIPSVTEDLKVTVEGVGKVQNNTTDVIFNVDLTATPSGMTGTIMLQDRNSNFIEEAVASGQMSTAAITAGDHEYSKLRVYGVDESLITGWEVNGTVYAAGGKQYVGDLTIWNRGYYLQVEYNGTTPITVNVKPVVEEVHIHDYESVVTPPTCTEGGYTTYTCKAGDDTYVAERVPALGHTNVNGTCSVCGAALTVIPEGATFLDMMTSDGKAVTVTDLGTDPFFGMGKLYKVEVPVGTIQVNITLDQSKVYVDEFGYAKTMMQGFDNVTEDGYGQTTKDGKVTVGLQMEKAPANGSSSTIRLLNVPYPEDVSEVKAVGLINAAYDGLDFYAFTYMLAEGQYYANLPDSFMYTVTGDGVASNGYKFNVSINNGYEATEDFAVRVNGEIVANQPGEVTVASVTEDLTITVEGVNKIYNPETDVSITVDLTEYTGEIEGQLWFNKKSGPSYTADLVPGKNNTIILEASDLWQMFANIYSIGSDVIGYDINGEIRDPGYLSFGFNVRDNAQPGKYVIKPIVGKVEEKEPTLFTVTANGETVTPEKGDPAECEQTGYEVNQYILILPAGTTSITLTDESGLTIYEGCNGWPAICDGETSCTLTVSEEEKYYCLCNNAEGDDYYEVHLYVVVEEGSTEPDTGLGFTVTANGETVVPVADGEDTCMDMFPVEKYTVTLPAGTTSFTLTSDTENNLIIYKEDRTHVCNALTYTTEYTGETFYCLNGIHLYVTIAESEQPTSNPITEIEVSHPNIEVDETTGTMTMAMVTGASEQIDVSTVLENAELEATQVVAWFSSDENVATVVNGKVTALKAGSTVITAKAVDESPIALLADGEDVLAQFTLTVADPAAGYTLTMGEDVEAVVNNTVSVPVTIGHTGDVTKYNAFDLTFEYDPTVLELTSTKIDGMTVTVKDGKIHVERYGTDLTVGSTALTLTFKAIATGNTNVKVTSAKVDISESALTQDAPDASVIDNITLVAVTGFTVSLPAEFTGESSVLPGENYTFEAKDKNYNYTFDGSTMDGQPVTVKDNGDGTFTIENVTGNIVIQTVPTGKTFSVTLGEDMTDNVDQAQYMTDYTATLTKKDGFTYNIKVTIGGKDYTGFTYDASTGLITIPGEAITGEIVFNSNKTAKTPDKHSVEFTGEYGDIAEGTLMEVDNGTNYILTINKVLGYKYTVTATMAGEPAEVIDNGDGTYTIENVTGDLVITIAKEYDLAVNVDEYVKLNGKVMFLVTATATVDEGKVLSYNGTAMFYSNQYNAWSFLVITEGTLSVDDAKNLITLNEGTKVELDQTYNVNESVSGTVDINDAQLVFDMYNNKYQDFTNNATMQKFLKADVNGDKTINTSDAAAVVSEIVKNK